MEWLKNIIIRRWAKGALDKLPFNYKKTAIGVAILAIGIAMMVCGSHYPEVCGPTTTVGALLGTLLAWLRDMDAETIAKVGGVIALGGGAHKWIKHFDAAEKAKGE